MRLDIKGAIKSLTEGTIYIIDNFERLAIVIVSRIAPWAAPLAPAFLVARATADHFKAPLPVAIAVAVTVEAVGIAATHITMEMYQYNQTKRKSDPKAPFDVGLAVAVSYFFIGITLTVLLELFPGLIVLAPAAFFLLAVVAYITLALMSGHARRVQGIQQEKEDKAEQRKRNRGGTLPEQSWAEPNTRTRERARAILAERPGISGSELGRELGRSAGLGRRLKREIVPELSDNGNGPKTETEQA